MRNSRLFRAKSLIFPKNREDEPGENSEAGEENPCTDCRRTLFKSESGSEDTIITISDSDESDHNCSHDDFDMSPEENKLFSSTSDDYTAESWQREIENFYIWVNQTCRKLDLMHEIARLSGRESQQQNSIGFRALDQIYRRIKDSNENRSLEFEALFETVSVLNDFCTGSFVFDYVIVSRLKHILQALLSNPGFQEYSNPHGAAILKNFLKEKYQAESTSVVSIFRAWKTSPFFSDHLLNLIQSERKYLSAFYFSFLTTYVDSRLKKQSENLTSILELGMKDLETIETFLSDFQIPYSGPFKKVTKNGLKVQLFISAVNPVDSVINNMIPLYGVYEFRLSCLNMTPENAQIFVNNLSFAPAWIVMYPPLFHGTISEMRRQITYL